MAVEVSCPACRLRFTVPAELYERKVKGRVTTIRCIECGAAIGVDGTDEGRAEPPAKQKPPLPARAKPKPPTRNKPPPVPARTRPSSPAPAESPPRVPATHGDTEIATERRRDPDSEPPTPRLPRGYHNALQEPALPDASALAQPEPQLEAPPAAAPVNAADLDAPTLRPPTEPAKLEIVTHGQSVSESAPPFARPTWSRRRSVWLIASLATFALVVWGISRSPTPEPIEARGASSATAPSVAAEESRTGERAEPPPRTAGAPGDERGASASAEPSEEPIATTSRGKRASSAAASPPSKAVARPAPSAAAPRPAEQAAALAPFDSAAAASSLSAAAAQASGCRKPGDPPGSQAIVVVTFAPSGRVTSAIVSGKPFAGTETGGCIAAAMRRAQVPAFSGQHITVSKTVPIR